MEDILSKSIAMRVGRYLQRQVHYLNIALVNVYGNQCVPERLTSAKPAGRDFIIGLKENIAAMNVLTTEWRRPPRTETEA